MVTSQRFTPVGSGTDTPAYDQALAKLMKQYMRRGMSLADARAHADGFLAMYAHHFRPMVAVSGSR